MGPNLGIDWRAAALGHGKNKRKTIGFGEYDKKKKVWSGGVVHIREVSLMSGGFGAAVWDAAIIMARWIYMHSEVFEGKVVHELGCGVGLPGLVAARFAKSLFFSDYLPGVLDNMRHNIEINTNLDFDEESDEEDRVESRNRKERILLSTTSSFYKQSSEEMTDRFKVIDLNWDLVNETSSGSSYFESVEKVEKADILFGSELTYSPKSVEGLIRTIDMYMKEDGVFYEILSTDRDGVSLFVDLIKEHGFSVAIHPVPNVILDMGKFKTNQRPESYMLYTCRKVNKKTKNDDDDDDGVGEGQSIKGEASSSSAAASSSSSSSQYPDFA